MKTYEHWYNGDLVIGSLEPVLQGCQHRARQVSAKDQGIWHDYFRWLRLDDGKEEYVSCPEPVAGGKALWICVGTDEYSCYGVLGLQQVHFFQSMQDRGEQEEEWVYCYGKIGGEDQQIKNEHSTKLIEFHKVVLDMTTYPTQEK